MMRISSRPREDILSAQPKLMIIPLPIIGRAGQSGGIATCVMVSVTKGELWIPMEYHRINEYIDSTVTYIDE